MSARRVAVALVIVGAAAGLGAVAAETFADGTSSPPAKATVVQLRTKDPVLVGAGDIASVPGGPAGEDENTAELVEQVIRQNRGHVTVFTAGDNAYENGTAGDYERYYDPTWGRFKAITKPSPGNHEYNVVGATGYFGYFRVRSYYAYNRGSWRIYSLNSDSPYVRGTRQERWLRRDLDRHHPRCILAYWHHPRWSSGQHNSDPSFQSLWSDLAAHDADVVVQGHDHDYERFAPKQGIRGFVVGTGGRSLYPFFNRQPGSLVRNSSTYGVIAFTLHRSSYDFQFIPAAGGTFRDRGSFRCHPKR